MYIFIYTYTITQLPLRHRPQYELEWMFEFIKDTSNFGLPRILPTFRKLLHNLRYEFLKTCHSSHISSSVTQQFYSIKCRFKQLR